jgi:hypothetical protein
MIVVQYVLRILQTTNMKMSILIVAKYTNSTDNVSTHILEQKEHAQYVDRLMLPIIKIDYII